MALVVFFRAANVGGHQVFQPGVLAKKLTHLGVVNLGAAGTFVAREKITPTALRKEILAALPFQPELIVLPAQDVLALLRSEPFQNPPPGDDVTCYVSILTKKPRTLPPLPLEQPVGGPWEVQVFAITGQFALSFQRPGRKKIYPNAVIEKQFGVAATTRNWNTIVAIGKILLE